MQAKIQAVKDKVAQCIALAEAKFGIKMPQVNIRFDLKGNSAGMAGCSRSWTLGSHSFYVRFNVQHMALGGKSWEHILNDTVPHELAHTVCQAFPQFGRQHDTGWKRVCVALGGNGSRLYSAEDAPEAVAMINAKRNASRIQYITTSGHVCVVSAIVHGKIQRGATYTAKGGKGRLTRDCNYSAAGTPVATATPTPVVPKATVPGIVKAVVAGSKADMIRAYLKQAKRDTGSEAEEKTIVWAIATLGMTRTLARTYVKNNWNKV